MRKKILITPRMEKNLALMGEQIKLARLRRNISTILVCQRAGISRPTLNKVEKGAPDVALGTYALVLQALGGLDKDLLLIAKDDVTGRTFQELGLLTRKRALK